MANGLIGLTGGAESLAASNPGRRLGQPEDIAGTVVFLSSRAGSHINGAVISIDGGEMLKKGGQVTTESDNPDKRAAKL